METNRIEPVRGMNDVLPENYEVYRGIEAQLKECFESFGYRPIDVPIVEHTDLYLRKSGEEIVTRMYDFVYQNRRLCLRPEMTASVIRAYVDNIEEKLPLPVRLYYSGSVFRYERPQRARYRQFTQVGVELIGSTGTMSDAEVIWTACKGLNYLGLHNYRVVISHIGVLTKFLSSLNLGSRLQNFLLSSMEVLRQENGRQKLEQKLQEIYPDYQHSLSNNGSVEQKSEIKKSLDIFHQMKDEDARVAILELLSSLNVDLKGTRSTEEIADRLLEKIKSQDRSPRLDKALDFMEELVSLKGEPFEILEKSEYLLPKYGIDSAPLSELRTIVEILKLYNIDWGKVSLDLGLSRGIQYYTGTIFEIHHGALGEARQLCGGGRYDELVTTLGGRKSTPATGFSFGLERVFLALESEGNSILGKERLMNVFVIALDIQENQYAIHVAETLRDKGLKVELDVRDRSVSKNLQYADKHNFPFVIIVGSDESSKAEVTLRSKAFKEGKRMTVDEAAIQIFNYRREG